MLVGESELNAKMTRTSSKVAAREGLDCCVIVVAVDVRRRGRVTEDELGESAHGD